MQFDYDASKFKAAITAVALASGNGMEKWALPMFDNISLKRFPDGMLEIAATDRYRLAMARIFPQDHTGVIQDEAEWSALLDAKALLSFVRLVKTGKRAPSTIGIEQGLPVTLRWDKWAREIEPFEGGTFPNYRKLLATKVEPDGKNLVRFNPLFLVDAARGCSIMSTSRTEAVGVEAFHAGKPALFTPYNPLDRTSYVHLLMPIRFA